MSRAALAAVLALAVLPIVLLSSSERALAGPAPVFEMFVPLAEQDISDALGSIASPATVDDILTTIDFTSAADDSVVYYDHWEDGYETDIANPVQSTTRVWGDNNAANGSTPGAASDDVDAGTVIFIQNTVEIPRVQTDIRFDGRDRIASTRGFALTRAGWDTVIGTLHAGAVATTDLSKYGTEFDVPVGENLGLVAFNYTGVGVMASDDNTLVEIDTDGDGDIDVTTTLGRGQTTFIDGGINAGATIQTSKPAQAHIITGERGSNYEGRWYEVFPREIRGDEYVAASAGTSTDAPVTVFLQNPNPTPITVAVDANGTAGDTNINIGAGAFDRYTLPVGSGARFSSPGNPFVAVSATGAIQGGATNYTHWFDWGYSLVPTAALTPGVVVGWGDGSPGTTEPTHSPVWVTPLADTNLQVDWDPAANDGFEQIIPATAFESVQIVDTDDDDLTGARIQSDDGTLISAAWGQDPADGECCAAYDLGTAVLPTTSLVTTKAHLLVNDLNSDGQVNPGDTIEYTVRSVDAGALALTNLLFVDVLPSTVDYVPNSTTLDGVAVPDDTVGSTIFPVDESGVSMPVLAAGEAAVLKFRVTLVNPFPLFTQNVRNDVSVTADQANSTATSIVPVQIPDLYIAKNAPTDPVMPGETFDYTLDVSNVSFAPQTGIDVTDPLPSHVTWNSTSVTRPIDDPAPGGSSDHTDTFTTVSYANNAANWTTNWIETDPAGAGPSAGDVRIISELGSNRLRLQAGSRAIRRTFDASSWDKAFVDFDWRRSGFEAADSVSFQVSTTGGSSWIELDEFSGPAEDVGYNSISYDLTRYVGGDISLRFITSSGMDTTDQFFVDDFRLQLDRRVLSTVPGAAPPALYTGGELLTGENLTVTVSVTVDPSIDPSIDSFDNTASATSTQNPSTVFSTGTVQVARASIGDTVWHDVDGDGVVDGAEPRLSGVTVELRDAANAIVGTDVTDGSGNYLFDDLDPGDYTVTVIAGVPAGMAATDDADGGQDETTGVTVTFGEDNDTVDFGYAIPVTIGDRVFGDIDGDGVENGVDFGIDGLTVTITGTSANASHQSGTTTTTSSGTYSVGNLLPGTYDITVDTTPLSTAAYETTSANGQSGDTQTITVTSGNDDLTGDFGYVLPAAIGDLVWHDLDADGVRDVGEPPMSGVTVRATGPGLPVGGVVRTTDANGYYLFADLDAGSFTITVTGGTGDLPAGYDSSTGGYSQTVSVLIDELVDTADFGFYTQASIGDFVFEDVDGSASENAGDVGLDAIDVTITGTSPGASHSGGLTQQTVNGAYDFIDLEPGTYTVEVDTSTFPTGFNTTVGGLAPTPDVRTLTVQSADDHDVADFGYLFPASIGDFVWHDLDGDGVFDTGTESGLAGVELTITGPGLPPTGVTQTTGASGAYAFSDLAPGTYTVTASGLPVGYSLSTTNAFTFTVDSDDIVDTADFGAYTTADIGDFVFHDLNADGDWDAGEPVLGGVDVTLTGIGPSGAIAPQTDTTDGSGNYLFTGLEPGTYTVTVDTGTVPAGYTVTAGDDTRSTTLQSGVDDLDLDLGYATTTSVGDYVWDDLDGDGTQNDGPAATVGIAGVDVTITGTSAGASHPTGSTVTTDADGGYLFDNLAPGTYDIVFDSTGPLAGTVTSAGALTRTVTVVSDSPDLSVDLGVYTPADIGDLVFDDANGDGTLDLPDDVGIDGVTVTLTGTTASGPITPIVTTTANGAYSFDDLAPGDYTVTLTSSDLPAGAVNTVGGTSQTLTLASGVDDLDVDFGFYVPAALGDLVFADLDGDGVHEPGDGDVGLAGVTISLYSGPAPFPGNLITTDTTDSSGLYGFSDLAPGTYTVLIDTGDLTAGAAITTGGTTYTTTLTSGNDDLTLDYGVADPITVGDFVFEDLNGDGDWDAGEPGIDGIDVTITGTSAGASHSGGSTVATVNGFYEFTNLLPGTYDVAVNAADVTALDATYTNSSPTTITATYESGDDVDTVDFGFVRPTSLGDLVFEDLDGDGTLDTPAEGGLAGVTLELSGPGVVPGTTVTTTAGGAYSFGGLLPGTYTVTVTGVPAGYTNTLGGVAQTTTLVSNTPDNSLDFGYYLGASIGDEVYDDLDGDGTRDPGEPGLDNVVLTLTGTTGSGPITPITADTGTGGTGAYDFVGLEPGTYTVTLTSGVPASMVNTEGGASHTFTVTSGDDENGADFGFYTPGSIGDYVWDDLDGNGSQDDGAPVDRGIANVTVTLTGTTASGAITPQAVDTDANGAYDFTGLAPGTYDVTIDTADLAPGAMSTTGGFAVVGTTVESGDDVDTIDFGVANPASIGDLIFADNDGTGAFSAGDANLDGVTVTLTGGNLGAGSIVDVTGTDGIYGFTGLYPGTYTVTVSSTGDLSGDEFSTTGGLVQTVTVVSGEADDTIDFGFAEPASIGDLLFHDRNNNAVQDLPGEAGIVGVDITITGTSAGASHPGGSTIQTGPGGAYAFTNLLPGDYTVTVDTGDAQMNPAFVSTTGGDSVNRTITAGAVIDDADFGYAVPVTIGDFVFIDPDGDGDQSDAVALGGVQLELRDALNGLVGTTTSAAGTGAYSFTGVMPGSYTINVVGGLPAGAFSTTGGNSQSVVAVSATDIDTVDFGYAQPATIGNQVYVDADADGSFGGGDTGFGATITLTGTSAGASHPGGTTVTATGGSYSIGGLNPGTYDVEVSGLPADAVRTEGAAGHTITVASGDTDNSADFGFWTPGSIGDEVFEDMNGDGSRDLTDVGLAGVTLELSGPGVAPGTSITTDGTGDYSFDNLQPGTYTVTVVGTPAGSVNTLGGASRTITITSGTDHDTADFGYFLPSTIGDYVWDDLDGDGNQDDGAPADRGIAGVELTLSGTTAAGAITPVTTTTDGDGAYDFGALAPGTYQVAITSGLPAGAASTTGGTTIGSITVTSGTDHDTADFGVALPASLGDLVFEDVDGDGTQDLPGDGGFAGVTVTVTGTSPGASHPGGTTTTTGIGPTAGDYSIGALLPGTYEVTVTPGTGNLPADASSSTGGNTQTVTLISGQVDDTLDFGYTLPASIGDQLFVDNNANGLFDAGDVGIADVDVTLEGPGQPVGGTTQATGPSGLYDFTDLTPGTYTVSVDVTDPEFTAIFGAGAAATQVSSTGGDSITLTIGSTDDVDTADFGYWAPGSIGDLVFDDVDGDGVRDPGDPGLENVTVTLSGGDLPGPITTMTGTGANAGDYTFPGLTPGDYTVTVTVAGMTPTTAGGTTQTHTLVSGTDVDTADFGFVAPASVGDLLFDDLDGDGVHDAGEPGLENVTVTLTGTTAAGAITPIVVTTGTGVNAGSYQFDNLVPGDYTVTVTDGTGDLAAATYTSSTGGNAQSVTLQSGDVVDTLDFGYVAPATIGDFVFDDLNGDGTQDPGEPGFENVTVQISGGGLATPITTTTGTGVNAGVYSFTGLAPGTYSVDVVGGLPAGAVTSLGTGGYTLTVDSNETRDDVDFGAFRPISIGDLVFIDENGNATFNVAGGDSVLPGVELTLSGTPLATDLVDTTDGSGIYGFAGLAPGAYTLTITDGIPADHVSTTGGNSASFTLVSGGDRLDLDFGLAEPISIGDLVWHDGDGDGVFDLPGEAGIGSVQLELVDGGNNVIATETTAGDGSYLFSGVMPSPLDYTVRVVSGSVPAGYTPTTPESFTVTATSGDDVLTADVGYVTTTSIGDYVWDDLDGDGAQNDGAPVDRGIAGLTVTLTGASLATPLTDTTDGDGGYLFDNLAPGTYTVTVTPPVGATATTLGGNSQTITVLSNDPVDTVDFGYAYGASIGDRIWHDLDANGTDDAEPGLGSVEVQLSGNGVNLSDTTDGNGNYLFTGLLPGTYTVTVNNTTVPVGANSGSQMTPTTPVSTTLTVGSGDSVDTVDSGYATTATIGDTIFDDLDGDGTLDLPTEPGLDGVTVELVDAGDNVVATEVTVDGAYLFTGVTPGTYTVRVVTSTLPSIDYAQTTSAAVATVTVDSDDDIRTVDLGFSRPSTIGDFVWHDLDADGVHDVGEPPLVGVKVDVFDSGLTLVGSDTTDGTGAYLVTGIDPGTYTVQVDPTTIPAGVNSGAVMVASVGVPASISRTVTSGSNVADADFAFHTSATIGDTVWHDRDANGADDDGAQTDLWLDGITIELVDPGSGGVVASTTTVGGVYGFSGVAPGTYEVRVDESTVPLGYTATTGNNPTTVTVVSDEVVDTVDFGYAALTGGAIGNEIFDDLDGDGVRDAGEPGIVLTVELWRSGALVDTRTSTGGGYNFVNLPPGDYEVRIDPASIPAGYGPTTTGGNVQAYTILSGDAPITIADFGYVAMATIGDFVWHDRNDDGLQNDDAPFDPAGLGGVTVELRDGATVVDSTVTAADGSYSLSALPGTYDVVVIASTVPAGANSGAPMTPTTVTSYNVTLTSNEVRTDADFGWVTTARIGDTIFDDLNGDGVQQAGEPGLVGVTVVLTDGLGGTTTAVTGPGGFYEFTGVAPGDYGVSVDETTTPGGSFPTTTGSPVDVSVASDALVDDVDLGYAVPATISGEIFVDATADGVQTGDDPIAVEIDVELLDAGGNVVDTVTTVGGSYTFTNVIPGDYSVRPVLTSGQVLTVPDAGSDDTIDSDVVPATGETGTITVTSGAAVTDVDAGIYLLATVGDTVFVDLDGDGVQGGDEPGLGGVAVTVRDAGGNVIGTAVTDADGVYSVDVRPGSLTVAIDLPAGYGPGAGGSTQTIDIESGEHVDTVDFPLIGTGSLSGSVVYDVGNDGSIDAGDPGLGGITVTATWDGPDGPVVYTTTTNPDGSYAFLDLPPGDYAVVVDGSTLPDGIIDPTVDPDSSIDLTTDVSIGGGSTTGIDFGVSGTARLGDNVFLDLDDDGELDPDEVGVAGVRVIATVTTANGVMTYQTVTDANGNYEFTDLPAGEYTITIDLTTIPAGMRSTVPSLSTVLVINGADDSMDLPLVMVEGPTAVDDSETTPPSTPVVVTVLTNDTVQPGTTVTVTSTTTPDDGVAVINADGTITYTPDDGFDGTDTFDYTICDLDGLAMVGDTVANRAILCSTATVTVVVPPPAATTPTPTEPPATIPPNAGTPSGGSPSSTTTATTSGTPSIPRTGAEHGAIQGLALGLLAAGFALWLVSRRRRDRVVLAADRTTRSNAWPAPGR